MCSRYMTFRVDQIVFPFSFAIFNYLMIIIIILIILNIIIQSRVEEKRRLKNLCIFFLSRK